MTIVVRVAIKRPSLRARPHVGEERREVVTPTVADADTASAVVSVKRMGLGVAALFHAAPAVVFGAVRRAVSDAGARARFSLQAPARLRVAGAKIHLRHGVFGAAGASTQPRAPRPRAFTRESNHGEPTKGLAHQIERFTHMTILSRIGSVA